MIDVVVIEDDPMVSRITEIIINKEKEFNVIKTFFSSDGVVEYLIENKIELIILDMYLPDTIGLDLLEDIREKEKKSGLFINTIFVTASNDKSHIERAFQLGVVDYLIKPFEFERLKLALKRYLIKKNSILEANNLTQKELDGIYHGKINEKDSNSLVPKGINSKTLEKVKETIRLNPGKEWSAKEMSEILDTSSVTVKKYLDYLVELGKIKSDISYGSVGRPEVKYKNIKKK